MQYTYTKHSCLLEHVLYNKVYLYVITENCDVIQWPTYHDMFLSLQHNVKYQF